jgi:hypothetical protein
MKIFAIDPGPTQSAWVKLKDGIVYDCAICPNHEVYAEIILATGYTFAIEQIRGYGMVVGAEVFETCEWCGRFDRQIELSHGAPALFIPRREVKLHLCGTSKAKDPNVRQALIDLLGPQGVKKAPGPTYGVKSHMWAALGVAVTAQHRLLSEVAA